MSIDRERDEIEFLYYKLVEKYENYKTIHQLSSEERNVLLIVESNGIINNGGFQYLFEGNLPEDENLQLTLAAYNNISEKAYNIFSKVLSVFPDNRLLPDIDERLKFYHNIDEEVRNKYDLEYFAIDDIIIHRLYKYAKKHHLL